MFEPVERLVLDVLTAGEDMAQTSRCTVLLLPVDGGTRLELTVEGLSDAQTAEHMRVGWQSVPDALADVTGSTRALLMTTHLVAAAVIVPALARRLP